MELITSVIVYIIADHIIRKIKKIKVRNKHRVEWISSEELK